MDPLSFSLGPSAIESSVELRPMKQQARESLRFEEKLDESQRTPPSSTQTQEAAEYEQPPPSYREVFIHRLKSQSIYAQYAIGQEQPGYMENDPLELQLTGVVSPAPGTGRWIFNQQIYEQWRTATEGQNMIMFALAGPGCGKSVLAKSVVREIRAAQEHVIPFFCKRSNARRESLSVVISSILYKLLTDTAINIPSHAQPKGETWSFKELWALFSDIVAQESARKYTIVVDALDECTIESQRELHHALSASSDSVHIRMFFTARNELYPVLLSKKFLSLELDGDMLQEDLVRYISYNLKEVRQLHHRHDDELCLMMMVWLYTASQGMILFAVLKLDEYDAMCDEPSFDLSSKDALRDFFLKSPQGIQALYEEMFGKVINLDVRSRRCATAVIDMLLAAQTDFGKESLACAYAFATSNIGDLATFERVKNADMFETSKRLCGQLIRVSDAITGKSISISHPSAREFLESKAEEAIPHHTSEPYIGGSKKGHAIMAKACLQYLLLKEMQVVTTSKCEQYPFLQYALQYWSEHVRCSEEMVSEVEILLGIFFTPGSIAYREWAYFDAWSQNENGAFPVPFVVPSLVPMLVTRQLHNIIAAIEKDQQTGSNTLYGIHIDLDARNEKGHTGLIIAMMLRDIDTMKFLLEKGASASATQVGSLAPLQVASFLSQEEMIQILIQYGAELDDEGNLGQSPLFLACGVSTEIVMLLLDLGAKRYFRSSDNFSILHAAVDAGDVDLVRHVLEANLLEDVNCVDDLGATALNIACDSAKSLEIVELLYKHGGDVNKATNDFGSPLYYASKQQSLPIVSFLIPLATPLREVVVGWTPLHAAADLGNTVIAKILLEAGAFVDAITSADTGETPLWFAAEAGHYDMCKLLCDFGAKPDYTNPSGSWPLFIASRNGKSDVVSLLIEKGSDTRKTKETMSALHVAAWFGHEEVVHALVKARAPMYDIDEIYESEKWTPLHIALRRKHNSIARLLLSHGADVTIRSADGRSALHYVCEYTTDPVVLDLVLARVDDDMINHVTKDGDSALHFAAFQGHEAAVKKLLSRGADTLVVNNSSVTPLCSGAWSGNEHVIEMLLAQDHLIDFQSKQGWTALHYASIKCSASLIERLFKASNWVYRRRAAAIPTCIAIHYRNLAAARRMLDLGFPVNLTNNAGRSALHEACRAGEEGLVNELLERGANAMGRDSDNTLPIGHVSTTFATETMAKLTPSAGTQLRKELLSGVFDLVDPELLTPQALEDFEDLGLEPERIFQNGETLLHVAAVWDLVDVVQYLSDLPQASALVPLKTHFGCRSPILCAARSCSSECLALLMKKCKINFHEKDFFGLSAVSYAKFHRPTLEILKEADPDAFYEELQRHDTTRISLLNYQICVMIKFIQTSRCLKTHQGVYDTAVTLYYLTEALMLVGDTENGITSYELLFGPPTSISTSFFSCSICRKGYKDPGHFCLGCNTKFVCFDCKEKTSLNNLNGCYNHNFVQIPRKSWYTRESKYVNDDDETEEAWLSRLASVYMEKRDPSFDSSQAAQIHLDYPPGRPDVFLLCRAGDFEALAKHYKTYPRDIWLRNISNENITMAVIEAGTTDDETFKILSLLAAEGADMLARYAPTMPRPPEVEHAGETALQSMEQPLGDVTDIATTEEETAWKTPPDWETSSTDQFENMPAVDSTVKRAFEKGFQKCATLLLEHFDPSFDDLNDSMAPKAMDIMISQKWHGALKLAIERHFDWVARGRYSFLRDYLLDGMTDQEIVEVLKSDREEQVSNVPDPYSDTLLAQFRQPVCSLQPKSGFHYETCVHQHLSGNGPGDFLVGAKEAYVTERPPLLGIAFAFCGLAGIFPGTCGTMSTLHTDDRQAVVTLSFQNSDGSEDEELNVSEVLQNAGKGLLHAMALVQDANACCDSFTVISAGTGNYLDSGNQNLMLCRLTFESVIAFVTAVESDDGFQSGADLAKSILELCDLIPRYRSPLELCCLAMQVLSLGFLSFLSKHLLGFQLPALAVPVSQYNLCGDGDETRISFSAFQMACIGEMVKDELCAFSIPTDHVAELQSDEHGNAFLEAKPVDLFELWEPQTFPISETDSQAFKTLPICSGQLFCTAKQESGQLMAHWSRDKSAGSESPWSFTLSDTLVIGTHLHVNTNCPLHRDGRFHRESAGMLPAFGVHGGYWQFAGLNLGASVSPPWSGWSLAVNLNRRQGRTMKDLVVEEWTKRASLEALMGPWGLKYSFCTGFATRISLGHAIAEVLIPFMADVLDYGPDGERFPPNWEDLKTRLVEKLRGGSGESHVQVKRGLKDFINGLTPHEAKHALRTITYVLELLKDTGVLPSRLGFRIAWVEPDVIPRQHVFRCSGKAKWVAMLRDSAAVATFAVATQECLATHRVSPPFATRTSCHCKQARSDFIGPLRLLRTEVFPTELRGPALMDWRLSRDYRYRFNLEPGSPDLACDLHSRGGRNFLVVRRDGSNLRVEVAPIVRSLGVRMGIAFEDLLIVEDDVSFPGIPSESVLVTAAWEWERENYGT